MLILGLDTCSMSSSAAVVSDEKMIAQFSVNHKKTHSERIMPQIEAMFKSAGILIEDIDGFAASVGPGSFTGVRIGVSTIKAFAQALNKPCIKVSALEGLAENISFFVGIIAPILDARRNQVYNALFESNGKEINRLCPDRALMLDELLEELKSYNKNIIFTGDGVPVFNEIIKDTLKEKAFFAPAPLMYNQAASIALIGIRKLKIGENIGYESLVPEYVRLSQAEQEKVRREK